MSIPCIEILTPDLLEAAALNETENTKTYTFNIPVTLSKIIIKNTNLTALTIEYKTDPEDDFAFLIPAQESYGSDFIFSLPSPITVSVLKLTFTADNSLRVGKIIAANRILVLNEVLSTLNGNIYAREGHHYLADGTLLKWRDFTKFNLTLGLENITPVVKQNLENILKNNTFLTYIFYGAFDTAPSGEYALNNIPFFNFDRRRALYKTALVLLEK